MSYFSKEQKGRGFLECACVLPRALARCLRAACATEAPSFVLAVGYVPPGPLGCRKRATSRTACRVRVCVLPRRARVERVRGLTARGGRRSSRWHAGFRFLGSSTENHALVRAVSISCHLTESVPPHCVGRGLVEARAARRHSCVEAACFRQSTKVF